jgi:predicted RNA-binding Zn-ribbon protein involved in translation (DUF1610 family)
VSAENGWMRKDLGSEVEKKCETCGRSLYAVPKGVVLRCDGCGDPETECYCPDSRELA